MPKLTVEVLNPERLRNYAGTSVFQRGQAYYNWGRVQIEEVTEGWARCYVHGTHIYEVRISVADNYLYLGCECEYAVNSTVCKHEVAAALAVRDYLRERIPPHWSEHLSRLVPRQSSAPRRSSASQYLLFFSLQNRGYPGYSNWKIYPYKLAVNSLPRELRPEPDLFQGTPLTADQLANILQALPQYSYQARTPSTLLNPAGCINAPRESIILANLMIERAKNYVYSYSEVALHEYLSLLESAGSLLFRGTAHQPFQDPLTLCTDPGALHISITKDEEGIHLNGKLLAGDRTIPLTRGDGMPAIEFLTTNPVWIMADDQVVRLEDDAQAIALQNWLLTPALTIPLEEETDFLEKFYLPLAQNAHIESDLVTWEEIQAEPVPRLYLSDAKGRLQAQLRFGYGDLEVNYESSPSPVKIQRRPDTWTLVRVHRDLAKEEEAYRALSSTTYRLKRAPRPAPSGQFVLRANAHPVDFLLHSIPRLVRDGYEIYGEEKLKSVQVNRNRPVLSFSVTSGIDWFDVNAVVNFGDLEVSFKEIRKAVKRQERYIKLADGSIGEIPDEWLERYKHLFALGEESGDGLRLSNHHLTLLDQLLGETEQVQVDPEIERRRQRLLDFSGIRSVELPQNFQGELRPYQKAGYDWLHFLHEFEFGGCLADDMGLGKTIQVLAFLQSLKEGCGPASPEERPAASLVVVPRSLLVNWQREAARFTPELRFLEYFDQYRPKDLSVFDEYDVVITTYGVMLRDIELLRGYTFHYAILDESQAIKNPVAQTAKAARLLSSRHRLVLTGTPVENSSVELWSQFAFLNPGLLGNLDFFQSEFTTPIEKKGDEHSAQLLRRMVYPFILRRTKDLVAPELPPRSERILYSDMEPAQRKLYNRTRDYYRGLLLGLLETEGMNQTRMKILEGLLRLRQIANHPLLIDDKFRGASGKFDLLLETLETLQAEGHKVLVFSQFVSMLTLIRKALDERGTRYTYLDGRTTKRQDQVDTFQTDPDIPLFLISLKAGGLGLNLTAADYVIHVDPWWNPAVELQATDRTHRIGQDKPVFVYKLITRDSVEEKILQLQERKKAIVGQIISVESSFFKELTPEDVKVLFS